MELLEINNKIFEGKFNETGKLFIQLNTDKDVVFFNNWQNKSLSGVLKKEYINDISFCNLINDGKYKTVSQY